MIEATHEDRSRRVALAFLHSAVLIDDQAVQAPPAVVSEPQVVEPPQLEPLTEGEAVAVAMDNGRAIEANDGSQPSTVDPESAGAGDTASAISGTQEPGALDADAVQGGFVKLGIVCAILRPRSLADVVADYAETVSRADLVVLDWHINHDKGAAATNLILGILKSDGGDRRARLIAIYTNEPELESIKDLAAQRLAEAGFDGVEIAQFSLRIGHAHVVFLAKPEATTAPPSRMVSSTDLANRLVDEFTKATSGLLANLAMSAVTSIRQNTDRILSRFYPELDCAYVGQRAVSVTPNASIELALEIVLDEIAEVVDEVELAAIVEFEAVRAWLNYQLENGLKLPEGQKGAAGGNQWLFDVLDKGRGSTKPQLEASKPPYLSLTKWREAHSLTDALVGGEKADALDSELAKMTFLARRHSEPHAPGRKRPPRLVLGSVLMRKSAGTDTIDKYLVCLQPRCDSVRIDGSQRFVFVPLNPSTRPDRFDLVIEGASGELLKVHAATTPHEVRTYEFTADPNERVVRAKWEAVDTGGRWEFTDTDGGHFRWLGDLKIQHSQRIAQILAAKLIRVGMHESEWARQAADWG